MGPGDAIGWIGTLGARAAVGPIDGERLAHAHAAPGGGRAAAGGREVGDEVVQRAAHTAAAQPAKPAESDVRTAYSTATIAGAQPAMPVGSFDARWGGLR